MRDIKAGRPASMRDLNKRIVLNVIRKEKYISRIELCRIIGLKPPTMSNIINELLKEDLIVYHGKGQSNKKGGPSPDLYKINAKSKHYIGIDVSLKGIHGLILDLEANVVAQISCGPDYRSQESLTASLTLVVNTLLSRSGLDIGSIEGIGVGLSALVDANNGIIRGSAGIGVLNDYGIKEVLERQFGVDTFVDNDIVLLASGPSSEEDEVKNALCLGIRSGVGLGIIIDGKIYRGSEGMSGNVECFENAETEDSIVEKVRAFYARYGISAAADLGVAKAEDIEIQHVCRALQMNNAAVTELVKESCYNLGILAGKLIQLMNPDRFMVSGRIFNDNDRLFDYFVGVARDFCKNLHYENVDFRKLPLNDSTVAHNAAYHILQNFFNVRNVFF